MDSEEDDVKNFIEELQKKIEDSPDYKAPILLVTTEWWIPSTSSYVLDQWPQTRGPRAAFGLPDTFVRPTNNSKHFDQF